MLYIQTASSFSHKHYANTNMENNTEDEFLIACSRCFHNNDFENTTNEEVILTKELLFKKPVTTDDDDDDDEELLSIMKTKTHEQSPNESIDKKRMKITLSPTGPSSNPVKITFLNRGEIAMCRLRYRKTLLIPNGLCGTHKMFRGYWKFEINYRDLPAGSIEWSIVDLESEDRTSHLESVNEIQARESNGRTVCNRIVKKALNKRCKRLEDGSFLKNFYLKLCDSRITTGPSFFGLCDMEVTSRPSTPFPSRSSTPFPISDD